MSAAKYTPVAMALLALSTPSMLLGCGDPAPDSKVNALGPEDPNVPPGPNHRPGQPCLVCHQAGGKAQPFSVAGTVYAEVDASAPVGNANVYILDSANNTYTTKTNCAGNFFVRPGDFTPTYPYWATLRANATVGGSPGVIERDMDSPSYREGSCAGCHTIPIGPGSPGPVYVIDDPTSETLPPGCN